MSRPAGWVQSATGRSPMRSPGAPSLQREIERRFWTFIATGITSEKAAQAVGVSQAVGARWFRHRGGMPLSMSTSTSSRYLSFAEREEIGLLPAQFVKPYVKSNKNDTVDDAAIAEAVSRQTMRFVQVKGADQVELQFLHRSRELLVSTRTRLINPLRAFCLEFGVALRHGVGNFKARRTLPANMAPNCRTRFSSPRCR